MIRACDVIGDSFLELSGNVFDVAGNAAGFIGNHELAASFGVGAYAACGLNAVSDLAHMPGSVVKCAQIALRQGFSFKLANAGRKLAANICSFVVNAGHALKLLGITTQITAKLAPFLPWGDTLLSVNEVYSNVRRLIKKTHIMWSAEKRENFRLKIRHNHWDLGKNLFLATTALIAAIGISFSAGIVFAVSIGALLLSMKAFFAEQDYKDFASKHGTLKLEK